MEPCEVPTIVLFDTKNAEKDTKDQHVDEIEYPTQNQIENEVFDPLLDQRENNSSNINVIKSVEASSKDYIEYQPPNQGNLSKSIVI